MKKIIVMLGLLIATVTYGNTTNTNTVVRFGYSSEEVLQHPVDPDAIRNEWTQGYLDVVEKGEPAGQIVLLYRKKDKLPDQTGRLIRVTGVSERVDLGGSPGTKNSYANELIRVQSWTYVETTTAPNKMPENTARQLADPQH